MFEFVPTELSGLVAGVDFADRGTHVCAVFIY